MRFTTRQAIPYLSIIIAFGILCGAAYSFQGNASADKASDETHPQSHKAAHLNDPWGFYQQVGVLPPLTITEIDGNRLYWLAVGKGLHIGSLELEPGYSIVPVNFAAKHDGCYGVHYCKEHLVVLSVDEIDPKFCKVNKQ